MSACNAEFGPLDWRMVPGGAEAWRRYFEAPLDFMAFILALSRILRFLCLIIASFFFLYIKSFPWHRLVASIRLPAGRRRRSNDEFTAPY